MKIIPLQLQFRPELRTVIGNVDYTRFEGELKRVDELLRQSGTEGEFVCRSVRQFEARGIAAGVVVRRGAIARHEQRSMVALRCLILKSLLDESCRGMSCRLKGKTGEEVCAMFERKGFKSSGPNPLSGHGGYVNPKSGRSYHLDPKNSAKEPPHVDVNRLRKYKGRLEKRRFFQ